MKEKPILFSGPMVRAILEGRKTQTRRIVQVQPPSDKFQLTTLADSTARKDKKHIGAHHWAIVKDLNIVEDHGEYFRCPYGYPGDRLWVRETWWNLIEPKQAHAGTPSHLQEVLYRADWDSDRWESDYNSNDLKWRPSIFMPRWASRISLEITGVHVERLQGISEADASAEGAVTEDDVNRIDTDILPTARKLRLPYEDDRVWFAHLWDEINGKRASWESNPWVWVLKFQKVSG